MSTEYHHCQKEEAVGCDFLFNFMMAEIFLFGGWHKVYNCLRDCGHVLVERCIFLNYKKFIRKLVDIFWWDMLYTRCQWAMDVEVRIIHWDHGASGRMIVTVLSLRIMNLVCFLYNCYGSQLKKMSANINWFLSGKKE